MKEESKKYSNEKSKSIIQAKRLNNYYEELLGALEDYADEINASILPYSKKSCEETMMMKGLRRSSEETMNRKTHMENVEGIAVEIAKKLGLNVGIVRVMARNHDVGHTFLGHSGEWWISQVKEDYGIGYYTHNALGPEELLNRYQIYDKIVERIQSFHPEITKKEINRIKKSLWLIFDGINSHNGEKTESEFIPEKTKDEKQFLCEMEDCFIKKGFDKKIMPATIEGCLIRLCDKISYIPYDMLDGLHEGMIDKIDGEYLPILHALGITQEEIKRCNLTKSYEPIARKLQILFTKDVIQNSSKEKIKMSNEVSKAMHEMRNINNERIVKYTGLQEDHDTYTKAIEVFMDEFAEILLEDNRLEQVGDVNQKTDFAKNMMEMYEGTPYEGFIKYVIGINSKQMAFTKHIVTKSMKEAIKEEQKMAREMVVTKKRFLPNVDAPNQNKRIEGYIEYYQGKDNVETYSEEERQADVNQIFNLQLTKKAERICELSRGCCIRNRSKVFIYFKRFGVFRITQTNKIYFERARKKFKKNLPRNWNRRNQKGSVPS